MSGCGMGEVGKLFAALKERGVGEIAIVGAMTRPEFADLRLDWGAVKRAAELAQLFRGGDNGLLVGLARDLRARRRARRRRARGRAAPRSRRPACSARGRVPPDRRGRHRLRRAAPRRAVALRRRAGRGRRRRPGARDRGGRGNRRDAGAGRGIARRAGGCGSRGRPACSSRRRSAGRTCGSTCRRSARKRSRPRRAAQLARASRSPPAAC